MATPIDLIMRLKDQASTGAVAAMNKINSGLTSMRSKAEAMGSAIKKAMGIASVVAIATIYAFKELVSSLIDTASTYENLQLRLRAVSTSNEEAAKSFAWVKNFAAKTPYELEQVLNAFIKAKSYGIDPTAGALQAAGDAASSMGKGLDQAIEAMADARNGEFERLKEFGIKAKTAGDKVVFTWSDSLGKIQKTIASNSPEIIQKTLETIWNSRYSGAMELLAGSFDGMLSNLKDELTNFKNEISEDGPFDALKGGMAAVLGKIKELREDGTLKVWATDIGDAITGAVEMVAKAARGLASLRLYFAQAELERRKAMAEDPPLFSSFMGKNLRKGLPLIGFDPEENTSRVNELTESIKKLEKELQALDDIGSEYVKGKEFAKGMAFGPSRENLPIKDESKKKELGDDSGPPPEKKASDSEFSKDAERQYKAKETLRDRDEAAEERAAEAAKGRSQQIARYEEVKAQKARASAKEREAAAKGLDEKLDDLSKADDARKEKSARNAIQIANERREREAEAVAQLGALAKNYERDRQREVNRTASLMRQAGEDEVKIALWVEDQKKRIRLDSLEAQLQAARTYGDAMSARMAIEAENQKFFVQSASEFTVSEMRGAAQSIGDATAAVVVNGENGIKAFQNIGKQIAAETVSFLTRSLVEWIIFGQGEKAINIDKAATAVAASAAQTYAASFASSVGFLGPGAIGYAAGMTAAMTAGSAASFAPAYATMMAASGAGQADRGMVVPSDGSYLMNLKKGELFLPPTQRGGGGSLSALPSGGDQRINLNLTIETTTELNGEKVGRSVAKLAREGLVKDGNMIVRAERV